MGGDLRVGADGVEFLLNQRTCVCKILGCWGCEGGRDDYEGRTDDVEEGCHV
jgi:hypothetical protein